MKAFLLSWTVGSSSDCCGGNQNVSSWTDVLLKLKEVLEHSGTVTLDIIDAPEIGPVSLQVRSENGYSFLSLGENLYGDYNVRIFNDGSNDVKPIVILGDKWNSNSICADPEYVVNIFQEFFSTGNVPTNLLG